MISSPCGSKSFSPTGTPINTPAHTPPGTPPNEKVKPESGYVLGFFASLRTALYGEQQKEAQMTIRRKKGKSVSKKLGILEKVEEVGVENLLSASPNPYMSSRESSVSRTSSDWGLDELEDIQPGSLTLSTSDTIGQLNAPSFSLYGRPSLSPGDLGRLPPNEETGRYLGGGAVMGGRGPGRVISSPGEKRPPQLMGALGVPGTPGTGALSHPVGIRPDLGSVPGMKQHEESAGFIGSITGMFFGRKGGLL